MRLMNSGLVPVPTRVRLEGVGGLFGVLSTSPDMNQEMLAFVLLESGNCDRRSPAKLCYISQKFHIVIVFFLPPPWYTVVFSLLSYHLFIAVLRHDLQPAFSPDLV